MWTKQVVLLALASTLLLTGCPKKRKRGADDIDVAEGKRRAALFEVVLANIKKIDPSKAPPLTTDTNIPGGRPPSLSGYTPDEDDESVLVYREDLADLSKVPDIPFSAPHGRQDGCQFSLREVKTKKDAEYFTKETLRGCTKLRYLWVVRTTKVVKPKPGASAVDRSRKTETTSFGSGAVDGEVLGYEIATGKLVGGYRFSARNSSTPEGANTGNPDAVLEKDLTKNVVAAIAAGPKR